MDNIKDWALNIIFVVVVLALFGAVAFPLYKSAAADGQIQYCYLHYESPTDMPPVVRLYGYRAWRVDRLIGVFRTQDEATEAAKKINCQVH